MLQQNSQLGYNAKYKQSLKLTFFTQKTFQSAQHTRHLAHNLIKLSLSSGKFYSSIHNTFPLWKTKTLSQLVIWAGTQWAMAVLRVWSFLLSISINKASSFPTPGDIMYLTSSYSAKTGIKQSPWDPSIAVNVKGQKGSTGSCL